MDMEESDRVVPSESFTRKRAPSLRVGLSKKSSVRNPLHKNVQIRENRENELDADSDYEN